MKTAWLLAASAFAASGALAQQGLFPSADGLTRSGSITVNDCVKFASPTTLADAGAACGSGGSASAAGVTGAFQYNAGLGVLGGYAPPDALAALGAAPSVVPAYVSGRWYLPPYLTLGAGATVVNNLISLEPMICPSAMLVKTLGARVNTASPAGGLVQIAIYANNPATGRPTGFPLASTGDLSTASAVLVSATPVGGNFTLPAGVYWTAINANSTASGAAIMQTASSNTAPMSFTTGASTQALLNDGNNSARDRLYVASQTYSNPWPDLTSATFTETASTATVVIELQAGP